ncbi:MAG TPA: PQQ-dependent sugar dehydrogenase [Myxococcales bacterium]|nr:PQQ-dependent sugar dehydrogenase [Myxococcales bacterium]
MAVDWNRSPRAFVPVCVVALLGCSGARREAQQEKPPQQTSQTPVTTPAPPSWAQGRPADLASSTLAPHVPMLTATAAKDIPLDRVKLPPGFEIALWAEGVPNARSMAVGRNGTVFVGTRLLDKVYAVVDRGGRREVKVIAKGLHRPNGVAFHDGALYVAELSRIVRFDAIEERLDDPPAPVVVYDKLPKDEPHGWKFLGVGPDQKLYFNIGAPCNICAPPATNAQLVRMNLDGSGFETFARGIRQVVGFDWDPRTKDLWFTENQRDWLGEEQPEDKLNHASRAGLDFGFPYCHGGEIVDPEFGKGRSCSEATPPAAKVGPHTAPLGMRFYTGDMFPPEYKNRIVMALHGSWNKAQKSGYSLLSASVAPDGKAKVEPFATGWLQGNEFWGRPVDVQVMRDGALLVSDDWNGALYRISYRQQ